MSDDTPPPPNPASERARIEPSPASRRFDPLPVLYFGSFAVLALALLYLYQHPVQLFGPPPETAKIDLLRQEVEARKQEAQTLANRLAALESRPLPPSIDLKPLESRLAALESRPLPSPPDLDPVRARLDALERRPPTDLAPLQARVAALEEKKPADLGPLQAKVAALEERKPADLGPLQAKVAALDEKKPVDLAPLQARVAAVEERRPADLGPLQAKVAALEERKPVDLAPLQARVAAVEDRKPVDLAPLQSRVATLEDKKPVDLGPVEQRVNDLANRQSERVGTLSGRLDQLSQQVAPLPPKLEQVATRLDAVESQAKQGAASLDAIKQRAQAIGRLQAARTALEAGQRLGDIPGAPPALARFATEMPPTEAGLRLSFDAAAEAARRASEPAYAADQKLLDRMWTRAQQSLTVQQGERVVVGNPVNGVLEAARARLDAGDLAGAVKALDGLGGPAKAAMADWLERARALLEARAAIATLAAQG